MVSPAMFVVISLVVPTIFWSVYMRFANFVINNLKYKPESEFIGWLVLDLPKAFIGVTVTLMITLLIQKAETQRFSVI